MSEDTTKQLDKCSENIETIIKHENSKENVQTIDLRSSMIRKKTNRTYDLIDDEIKVVNLDNDLVVKLIANNKGVFIDFRKYYKGYPTKKGIRILATKFQEIAAVMNEDINRLVPKTINN